MFKVQVPMAKNNGSNICFNFNSGYTTVHRHKKHVGFHTSVLLFYCATILKKRQ